MTTMESCTLKLTSVQLPSIRNQGNYTYIKVLIGTGCTPIWRNSATRLFSRVITAVSSICWGYHIFHLFAWWPSVASAGVLKPHKAAGPDSIRPKVLKELAPSIAPILQIIFAKSLKTHQVPEDWKQALISPIYKKGNRDCPSNYLPISLTCICSQLMEHIVTSSMITHLERHNILYHLQHGFRHGRSCETQILELTTTLQANLNDRSQTDLIIMDFSKVFDKVSHPKLLAKLDHYGIRNDALKWISCFLNNRQQSVVVDGAQSHYLPVLSRVPQGSVLVPP